MYLLFDIRGGLQMYYAVHSYARHYVSLRNVIRTDLR